MKFVNKKVFSFRIIVNRETNKFLVTLEALQSAYIFFQEVLSGKLCSCI